MPDKFAPSEFGGKAQRNGIQPPVTPRGHKGHVPDASEKLRLLYLTGQEEDSTRPPDGGEAFAGILPLTEAEKAKPEVELWIDQNG